MSFNRHRHNPGPWRDHYSHYRDGYAVDSYDTPFSSQSSSSRYEPYSNDRRGHYRSQHRRGDYYGYPDFSDDQHSYTAYYERQEHDYTRQEYDSYRRPQQQPSSWRSNPRSERMAGGYSTEVQPYRAPPIYRQDDRPVTPPPPQSPSPAYVKLAEDQPASLASPTEQRKLLILDLNGTLVHRAPLHRTKQKPAPPALDDNGRPLPRLRPTHPRPYMHAFRSYMFAPQTQAWLDVMIWSSAQPHSVNDMAEKCFGPEKNKLLAVWARDTLGLSEDHYHRKVQTVKDLNTPWKKLAALAAPSDAESTASSRENTPRRDVEPASGSATTHSALTTLLLDDSPRKAELQPYNHFCVPEYSAAMRSQDLLLLQCETARAEAAETIASSSSEKATQPEADPENAEENTRKRRRKEKKEQKRLKAALKAGSEEQQQFPQTYDETLLAVIGVLEEVKTQRNVAAWMRAGGLWGPAKRPIAAVSRESDDAHDRPPSPVLVSSSPAALSPTGDDSAMPDVNPGEEENAEACMDDRTARRKERKHRRQLVKRQQASTNPVTQPELLPAGNDARSTPVPETSVQRDGTPEASNPTMWFEHPPTVQYWASRGRQALEELEIPVHHGISG